jgi:hypothetical protein
MPSPPSAVTEAGEASSSSSVTLPGAPSNLLRLVTIGKITPCQTLLVKARSAARTHCSPDDPDGRCDKPLHFVLINELAALSEILIKYLQRFSGNGIEDLERTEDPVSHDKSPEAEDKDIPPIFHGCVEASRECLAMLSRRAADPADDDTLLKYIVETIWYTLQFTTALQQTRTAEEVLAYLSVISRRPDQDFRFSLGRIAQSPKAILSLGSMDQDISDDCYEACKVRHAIMNSYLLMQPPNLLPRERLTYRVISYFQPQYSEAVLGWIDYARKYKVSNAVTDHICQLLPPNYNVNIFANLVLEFVRFKWPSIYGWDAKSSEPRANLTRALLTRDIQPHHFAAAFGLRDMCDKLNILHDKAHESATKESKLVGTPLWCALVGEDVFSRLPPSRQVGLEAQWDFRWDQLKYDSPQAETISFFIVHEQVFRLDREWRDSRRQYRTVGSLIFTAALQTGQCFIWIWYLMRGPASDPVLPPLIESFKKLTGTNLRVNMGKLLTILIDHLLTSNHVSLDARQELVDAAKACFTKNNLEFQGYAPRNSLKITSLSDSQYFETLRSALLDNDIFCFQRLLVDPRFEANHTDDGEDSMLHLAVADNYFSMVQMLLAAGASLKALDAQGRTPLMVIDSVEMISMLVQNHGAVTTDTEMSGRNIWHLAAGSNDRDLMKWLCLNDPWRAENMNARNDDGNTPLAECFLYLNALAEEPLSGTDRRQPQAARQMIKRCATSLDEDCLWSETPLPHLATEWGCLDLINAVNDLGGDFTEIDRKGQSVLYRLTLSASSSVVARVMDLCGESSPIIDHDGCTPAERIFLNVRLIYSEGASFPSCHPSCIGSLSHDAYMRLLTPETLAWQDFEGRGLWERFCTGIVMSYPVPDDVGRYESLEFIYRSIVTAIDCLITAGALRDYEHITGKAAITCFERRKVNAFYYEDGPDGDETVFCEGPRWENPPRPGETRPWNVKFYQKYFLPVLMCSQGSAADAFFKSEDAVDLMREAREERATYIVKVLASKGVQDGNVEAGVETVEGVKDGNDE